MARRLYRTGGDQQVSPDAILARRGGAPCSIGVPVSVARERGLPIAPLFSTKGVRSVFDGLEMELKLSDQGVDSPKIDWTKKLFTVSSADEKDYPKNGITAVSLFTYTRKMSCPSLSLPAGPTYEFGTCPAANHSKKGGLREEGKTYVCDGCYSLEGNYIFPNVAVAQAARLHWIRRQLEQGSNVLASSMISAIEDFARNGTSAKSPDGIGTRLVLELGIQRRGQLMVPVVLPDVGKTSYMPVGTELPPESGFADTHEWRAARGVPEGAVCGFFRIHDSGDFGVTTDPASWSNYIAAWISVAEALPYVEFWAPTRMWLWKKLFVGLSLPPNLTIRPSGLHVSQPAPKTPMLASGSEVRTKEGIADAIDRWQGQPSEVYPCPVYGKEDQKSCLGAGCRACWIWKNTVVSYRWH